nr:hypothetical protein [Tanacetum cinerariifolium]
MLPATPPSPDYIPGPEELQIRPSPQDEEEHELMFIQPHDLDFLPEPIYPEYIPLEDEHILPAKEQPLPPVVSPTVESPGYVAESNPEENPKEYEPHDPDFLPEPIYPEYIPLEDEHILPAKEQPLPPVVSPTVESPGYVAESNPEEDPKEYEVDETKDGPVDHPIDGGDDGDDDDGDSSGYDADDEDEDKEDEEEDEHLAPADSANSISLPPEAEVERLLAMPTPSPSPLTLLSPPSTGERLARCTAPTALLSPPLPPSLYPLPPADRRDDILESEQPPRKRLWLSTLGYRYEVGESFTRGRGVDYGFSDTV